MYRVPIGAWAKMMPDYEPGKAYDVQFIGYDGATLRVRYRDGREDEFSNANIMDGVVVFAPPLVNLLREAQKNEKPWPWWVTTGLALAVMLAFGKWAYNIGIMHGQREETRVTTRTLEDPERLALQAQIRSLSSGVEPLLACAAAFGVDEGELKDYFADEVYNDIQGYDDR